MERRERTRQLIGLGGLVQKAGLVELTGDDRAAIYGALLSLTDGVEPFEYAAVTNLWRRRGKRAFEAEQADRTAQEAARTSPEP
ncbi:conjugal transfer protein TraD [Phenylobacterium sp. LH3H17]|uniref:conjugal transfer protein TraD n=1 Tax=Phenylobacterium sp. LH3H17 TaxID=2903901 RepID=UPI0020C948C3|nr:conjugal transfer protein TraD [Phenylobacterium sp. LH3H17]UTP40930.1 conjugal transfer protein TraD [Phenylobacterium sp. LH3H17]